MKTIKLSATLLGFILSLLGGTASAQPRPLDFSFHYQFENSKAEPDFEKQSYLRAYTTEAKLTQAPNPTNQVSEVKGTVSGTPTLLGNPYHRTFRTGLSF
jgi:hypothetical protein